MRSGRLTFDVDGDEYEVGVGAAPVLALSSFEITGAAWAAAGRPVQLRLKVLNKGGARSAPRVGQMGKFQPRGEGDRRTAPASCSRSR